ncbi:MAG: hypothetical protein LBI20_01510 [Holosporales bacterium]|nr:hypothetical protein [Holosporales bacterium]
MQLSKYLLCGGLIALASRSFAAFEPSTFIDAAKNVAKDALGSSDSAAQLKKLTDNLAALGSKNDELKKQIEQIQKDLATKLSQPGASAEDIAALGSKYDELKKNIEQIQADMKETNESILELTKKLSQFGASAEDIAALGSKNDEIEKQIEEIQKELTGKLSDQMTKLQHENAQLVTRVKRMEQMKASHAKEKSQSNSAADDSPAVSSFLTYSKLKDGINSGSPISSLCTGLNPSQAESLVKIETAISQGAAEPAVSDEIKSLQADIAKSESNASKIGDNYIFGGLNPWLAKEITTSYLYQKFKGGQDPVLPQGLSDVDTEYLATFKQLVESGASLGRIKSLLSKIPGGVARKIVNPAPAGPSIKLPEQIKAQNPGGQGSFGAGGPQGMRGNAQNPGGQGAFGAGGPQGMRGNAQNPGGQGAFGGNRRTVVDLTDGQAWSLRDKHLSRFGTRVHPVVIDGVTVVPINGDAKRLLKFLSPAAGND